MHILSKVFYLFLTLFLTPRVYSQAGAPGQFKPQDIDAILNSMTEDDFNNILTELSKLSPQELEELEKIGRQVLLDSGIDPDTGKAIEQKGLPSELPPQPLAQTPSKVVEPKTMIRTQNPDNVALVIDAIIKQINTLRQKAQGNEQIARRLAQWSDTLNDLIFYLKVINKKVHHERLATKDFNTLFKNLESLSRQLVSYQQHIILPEKAVENDDPYKILGLPYSATPEEITTQFNKLKKRHDPRKITKQLKAEHATKKEISREKRAAELTLSLIQDAYDQLNDPKTKKVVDNKRMSQPSDQLSSAAQANLTKVLEAISNSVYQDKLLDQLQEFLKKYEPEQLEQKKTFEEAQSQRKKEQIEAEKTQAKLTYAKYDRTDYPQQLQAPNRYDNFGRGYFPSSFTPTMPTAPTPIPLAPIKKDEKEEKGGSAGAAGKTGSGQKAEGKSSEDNTKDMVKAIEKQNEDKKKKEAERKQKEMQEELELFRAKEKAQAKLEGKPAAETAATTRKRPQEKVSDRELIDQARSKLVYLKKEMRKDSSRKLFKQMQYKGGTNQRIAADALESLNKKLGLQELAQSLEFMHDNLPEDTKVELIKKEWDAITQEYSDTLLCLRKHLQEEEKKYTQAKPSEDLPQELQSIMSITNNALLTFNNLSKEILGRTPHSTQVECDEFLPVVKPVE